MNNIYLVGFMGTGKSIVGRSLAKKLKLEFVDMDESIELKEKRRISDIFAKDGEVYFRDIERKVLKQLSRKKGLVVSCGGGVVINKKNIELMKKNGWMVCLSANPEVILKRVKGKKNRPLLNVENPKKKIKELLKARASYYAMADKKIDTSKLTVKQVVDKIARCLK